MSVLHEASLHIPAVMSLDKILFPQDSLLLFEAGIQRRSSWKSITSQFSKTDSVDLRLFTKPVFAVFSGITVVVTYVVILRASAPVHIPIRKTLSLTHERRILTDRIAIAIRSGSCLRFCAGNSERRIRNADAQHKLANQGT